MFFADWFMRAAVNNGFPLNTVVSTVNFEAAAQNNPGVYAGSVIVSAVPEAGGAYEKAVLAHVKAGGRAIFFGPVDRAGGEFLETINVKTTADGIGGEVAVEFANPGDTFRKLDYKRVLKHNELLSAGAINTVVAAPNADTEVLAYAGEGGAKKAISVYRKAEGWNGGATIWLRGTNSSSYFDSDDYTEDALLLTPHNQETYFAGEILLRFALARFGISIAFDKERPATRSPIVLTHRANNAFFFSGFTPDTTSAVKLRFPLGAPLFLGWETTIQDGHAVYHMPRAFHCEARVFVEQEAGGVLSCKEVPSISFQIRRRGEIKGLQNAAVRIFPEADCVGEMQVLLNSSHPYWVGEDFDGEWKRGEYGAYFEARNVTGTLTYSMPRNAERNTLYMREQFR